MNKIMKNLLVSVATTMVASAAEIAVAAVVEKKENNVMGKVVEKKTTTIEPVTCKCFLKNPEKNRVILYDGDIEFPVVKEKKLYNYNEVMGFLDANATQPVIDLEDGRIKMPSFTAMVKYCGSAKFDYNIKPGDLVVNKKYEVLRVVKEFDESKVRHHNRKQQRVEAKTTTELDHVRSYGGLKKVAAM